MKERVELQEYPVFSLELEKSESRFSTIDEITAFIREKVESHPMAAFITVFDHLGHSRKIKEASIDRKLLAAKNVVFCFGLCLHDATAMATRPRSLGVAEYADRFVISFIEAPMPVVNSAMESWARELAIAAPKETAAPNN
ncbi:MAG: DUF6858 family protein [Thiotrichales bacterium]